MFASKLTERDQEDAPMLVIGAGVGRTGTLSLKIALEILYEKPCYHMTEIAHKHLDHVKLWIELHDRLVQDMDTELPQDVIRRIFKGYQLTTDHPGCVIYKQLMKMYPDAKVILTVRDPNTWIQSLRETVKPKRPLFGSGWLKTLKELIILTPGFEHMTDQSVSLALGKNLDLNDDEQMKQAFVRRNEEVKLVVPADRLLVFQVKEGWEPLCRFLGKPIPEVPFPHVNDRQSMKERLKQFQRRANIVVASSLILLGVALALGVFCSKLT
ncbi:unnamed protein product [Echinostoma caproni]|uniref:NAD dependent epimerase/dehydratase n=1 Tax=Echinostoma caproni TaxID=27848 RepID=A0A183AA27_9TREM|nr:unnamed protein product [Echinostoma caproni]